MGRLGRHRFGRDPPVRAAVIRRPCLDCGKPFAPRFAAVSRCLGCSRKYQAQRNQRPERAIYKGAWQAQSRAIRNAEPWCHSGDMGLGACAVVEARNLTVDHPTLKPLCRSHHGKLEQQRRKADRYTAVAERPPSERLGASPRGR